VVATSPAQRMMIAFQAVEGTLAELPEIAEEWSMLEATAAGRAELAGWSLEWSHMMLDRLADLDEFCRTGALASEQGRRYRLLLERLKEALPTITRLNLSQPSVPLSVGTRVGAVEE
jgi:hypothetical protein